MRKKTKNMNDEQEGKEAGTDEDKMDLQSKTGIRFDNRQGGQDQKTRKKTKNVCHG